jgi:hypothetical protein
MILAGSPGTRPVRLLLSRADGGLVQLDADLRIDLTPELREKLAPWLVGSNPERTGSLDF